MDKRSIERIKEKISRHNEKAQRVARAEFDEGPVPKMQWTMKFMLEKFLGRIAAVRSGTVPDELGSYTGDELARVLATRTYLVFPGLCIDKANAENADSGVSYEEVSFECSCATWTPQFGIWRQLYTALCEYMREAAIFAKSVNPSSTAARLYLRALRILQRVKGRGLDDYCYASKDEAIAIVRLECVATERLWVDAQFAALPPFKKRKTVRRKDAAKAKKSKKAN